MKKHSFKSVAWLLVLIMAVSAFATACTSGDGHTDDSTAAGTSDVTEVTSDSEPDTEESDTEGNVNGNETESEEITTEGNHEVETEEKPNDNNKPGTNKPEVDTRFDEEYAPVLYFGPKEIAKIAKDYEWGANKSNMLGAYVSEDESYVTLIPFDGEREACFYLFQSIKTVGPIMVVKYRTEIAGFYMEFFMNSVDTTAQSSSNFNVYGLKSNGEWDVRFVDVREKLPTVFNGTTLSHIRFDFANGDPIPPETEIDIEYIAFFNTMEDAQTFEYGEGYVAPEEGGGEHGNSPLYFGAIEISGASTANEAKNLESSQLSEDLSYVTLTTKNGGANDAYINLLTTPKDSAPYIAIKYRTEDSGFWTEVFMDSVNTAAKGGSSFSFTPIGDGEWHIYVLNVSDKLGSTLYNGEKVNYIRFDFANCNNKLGAWSIDFEYIAFYNTEEEAYGGEIPEGGDVEGEVIFIDAEALNDAAAGGKVKNLASSALSGDKSYVTLNTVSGGANDAYINLLSTPAKADKYFAIKYRTSTTDRFWIELFMDSVNAGATGGSNFSFYPTADGEWQVFVIDLTEKFGASIFNGKKVNYIRFDFANCNDKLGAWSIDVAGMGFFDSEEAALAKLGMTGSDDSGNTEGGETPEINYDPVFVMDAAYINGKIKEKATNIENSTVSSDGSFVTIDPKDGIEEAYAYLFTTTKDAARYMVIKYRTESPIFYMQFYLNTPDHSAGNGSISIDGIVNDGEWKIAIFDLASVLGASRFDGENLGHFRFDFINMKGGNKTSSETSMDVAYVAFFESQAAADAYAAQ